MRKIMVTKSYLPDMEEYVSIVKSVWETGQLTNAGPLVVSLEEKLADLLGATNFSFVSNGTIALQIAIKALDLRGEVITTPFSYVATTSAIAWEGCKPVFVDIDPQTLNIDPLKIENAITDRTQAIMATHVYGNPCDVFAIERIAKKHGLKVIYDAAHAFGVKLDGRDLTSFGDISTLSFHATKVFHTVEGGGIISATPELHHRVSYLRNFGHNGSENFWGIGINGKNSEFHAAMGLCLLKVIDRIIEDRQKICTHYDRLLEVNSEIFRPQFPAGCVKNFGYYPVIVPSEKVLKACIDNLNEVGIFPRRYFYPSLDKLNYVTADSPVPIASDISRRILCLPLYYGLALEDVEFIAQNFLKSLASGKRLSL